MKRLFLLPILVLFFFTNHSSAQLMINGSFEFEDGSAPSGSDDFSIEYATDWHALNNTPDLAKPLPTEDYEAYGAPRTGGNCARFGLNGTVTSDEYFYGKTQPLTSGTTYVISFWVRKGDSFDASIDIGAHISHNVPTPLNLNPYAGNVTANVLETINSIEYEKVSFCYTPTVTGTHYITFGFFYGTGGIEYSLYYLDDVEIVEQTIYPNANISPLASVFCDESPIIVDGSTSTDETEYRWSLYDITSGTEELLYEGDKITGTVNSIDINSFGINFNKGDCYRVYLTVYNGCEDVTSVDFCIEDPTIGFYGIAPSVCGNLPVNIQVTGDNGWTYSWSTGESGVGLKTVTVIPSPPSASYTVNVLTPLGCIGTNTVNLTVHDPNNVAPWMDGINGTGEYTIYVNQGDEVSFTSTLYNDNINEILENEIFTNQIPTPFYSSSNLPSTGTYNFTWNTGQYFTISNPSVPFAPEGVYNIIINSKDNNVCNNGVSQFTFTIIVICRNCPICLSYENRSLTTTPLPQESKAAVCINAGFSQIVSTENENILFQAGQTIELGSFFEAGPGFSALIENSTCITDCNDCCVDFNGYTFDDLTTNGYYYYMNLWDEDPTNDFFEITDIYHPFCAYNAKGVRLEILDNDNGTTIYSSEFINDQCCILQSRAPENPISHSDIYWDGHYYDGSLATAQTYQVVITFYGCGGEQKFYTYISLTFLVEPGGMITNNINVSNNETSLNSKNVNFITDDIEIQIYPNPTSSILCFSNVDPNKTFVQFYDEKGHILTKKSYIENGTYDITKFIPGTYYCRIYNENSYILRKFVKL